MSVNFFPGTASELTEGAFFSVEERPARGYGYGPKYGVPAKESNFYRVEKIETSPDGNLRLEVIDSNGVESRKFFRPTQKIETSDFEIPAGCEEILFVPKRNRK